MEQSIDILKSIVEAERLKRSGVSLTAKDEVVLASIAQGALRTQMLQQVQTIWQRSIFPRLPAVTE